MHLIIIKDSKGCFLPQEVLRILRRRGNPAKIKHIGRCILVLKNEWSKARLA